MKGKNRPLPKLPKDKSANFENRSSIKKYVPVFLFIVILAGIISFKIYKADRTGIIFDEARTFRSYAYSVNQALSSYSRPNNHILNSIFIYYAHKHFGNYEHFVRLPSLTAGICFSLALAYIIYMTIHAWALRMVSLAMISLVPFVFDYSFLARGYAFALAAIFIEIALVVGLLKHRIKFRYCWLPILVISAMNFLAFGAMLSSILFLAGFNFIFIVLYSPKLFRNPPRWFLSILINLICIPLIFIGSSYLIYRKIFTQIFKTIAEQSTKGDPYFLYLRRLLINNAFPYADFVGQVIFYGLIILIVIALLYRLYRFRRLYSSNTERIKFGWSSPQIFILLVTVTFLVILYIYNVILDRPLGYRRNQVFLIPLVLLCVVLILDKFVCDLEKKSIRTVLLTVITVFMAVAAYRNLPKTNDAGGQSMSVHLLRTLKEIDPDKTWNIGFSKKAKNYSLGILYYEQFGNYKFKWTRADQCDVYVCITKERPPKAVCLEWDFFRRFGCAVVFISPIPYDKIVIDAKRLE